VGKMKGEIAEIKEEESRKNWGEQQESEAEEKARGERKELRKD
jgi:hypothetical protein